MGNSWRKILLIIGIFLLGISLFPFFVFAVGPDYSGIDVSGIPKDGQLIVWQDVGANFNYETDKSHVYAYTIFCEKSPAVARCYNVNYQTSSYQIMWYSPAGVSEPMRWCKYQLDNDGVWNLLDSGVGATINSLYIPEWCYPDVLNSSLHDFIIYNDKYITSADFEEIWSTYNNNNFDYFICDDIPLINCFSLKITAPSSQTVKYDDLSDLVIPFGYNGCQQFRVVLNGKTVTSFGLSSSSGTSSVNVANMLIDKFFLANSSNALTIFGYVDFDSEPVCSDSCEVIVADGYGSPFLNIYTPEQNSTYNIGSIPALLASARFCDSIDVYINGNLFRNISSGSSVEIIINIPASVLPYLNNANNVLTLVGKDSMGNSLISKSVTIVTDPDILPNLDTDFGDIPTLPENPSVIDRISFFVESLLYHVKQPFKWIITALSQMLDWLRDATSWITSVNQFLSAIFGFLPEPIVSALCVLVSVTVVFSIFKIFRG